MRVEGLEGAYVVGGGYKYCQLGPGNAFLRFPADTTLRPVVTGWFSEFTDLSKAPSGRVEYGPGPARFAGATYDFTSHYRGAAVFTFFEQQRLTANALRALSQRQLEVLVSALGIETEVALHETGGFLALRTHDTARFHKSLRERNVWTDYRSDTVRLGPAPYVTDAQLGADLAAARGYTDIVEMLVHRGAGPGDSRAERVYFGKRYSFDAQGRPWRAAMEDWNGAKQRVATDPAWTAWLKQERATVDAWMAKHQEGPLRLKETAPFPDLHTFQPSKRAWTI